MILTHLVQNKAIPIVLASASPRRQELLGRMGLSFQVFVPDLDESAFPITEPGALVETLSREKADLAAGQLPPETLVIASDTVVSIDGRILGKPASREEAFAMLQSLSGRSHEVFTGLTVRRGEKMITTHEIASVRFRPLSDLEIRRYIDTGEPMDKAGAYGIQGFGALLVSGIFGDYFTVMGLPVCRLGLILEDFGVSCLGLASET